jgi:hypothetical protein
MSTIQLSVNAFLKFMTDRGLTMPQAISIATPLLKAGYNTEAKLATLNEVSLNKLHLNEDKHIKKTLLEIGKKVKKVGSSCLARASVTRYRARNDLEIQTWTFLCLCPVKALPRTWFKTLHCPK